MEYSESSVWGFETSMSTAKLDEALAKEGDYA